MIMNLEEARCFSMAAPSFPAEEGTYADLPVCQDRHTVWGELVCCWVPPRPVLAPSERADAFDVASLPACRAEVML